MEQTQVRVREHHAVLVRRLHTLLVHHASARRRQVLNAAPPRTVHVVREGEERVAAARDALQLREPLPLLLCAQGRGHRLKLRLPLLLLAPAALEDLAGNEEVDRVRLLRALHALLEGQREHARVVPQPPKVCLRAGKARAVDARLLACADADDRAVVGVGDTVRLGVLQCERGDDEIGLCVRRQL